MQFSHYQFLCKGFLFFPKLNKMSGNCNCLNPQSKGLRHSYMSSNHFEAHKKGKTH